MTGKIPDLWPPDFGSVDITTPLVILKTQATALAQKTHGVVEGTVNSSSDSTTFSHQFILVSRVLGYSYRLLLVQHDIALYPVLIRYDPTQSQYRAADEKSFQAKLIELFAQEGTLKIVRALIAQSMERGRAS